MGRKAYAYGYPRTRKGGFDVATDFPGLKGLYEPDDPTTTNSLLSANFVAANSEYLSSSSSDFAFGDESFSIVCWVKFNNSAVRNDVLGKARLQTTVISQMSYALIWDGSSSAWSFGLSPDGTSASTTFLQLADSISSGVWNMAVISYDHVNDLMKLSSNGSTFATTSQIGGAFSGSTADFKIGNLFFGIERYLDGAVDLPIVFRGYSLTQDDVTFLYNSGSGRSLTNIQENDPTLYSHITNAWTLNEQSGNRNAAIGSANLTDNNTVGSTTGKIQEDVVNSGDSVYTEIDKSGNNNNGIQSAIANQFTWNEIALVGNGSTRCLNLDALLSALSGHTVGYFGGWVKPVDATPASNTVIIGFGDTDVNTFLTIQSRTDGKCWCKFRVNAMDYFSVETDNAVFSDNTWTHVLVVQNGTQPKIYINGVLVAQSNGVAVNLTKWFATFTGGDNGRLGCLNFNSTGNSLHYNGQFGQWVAGGGSSSADIPTGQDIIDLVNDKIDIYS